MIDPSTLARARTLLAKLELISHGRAMSWERSRGGEGALFPPGGVNRDDDRDPESLILRSHLHYRRRIAGATSEGTLLLVIGEMEQTLKRWTHTASPPMDSLAWRDRVASSEASIGAVKTAEVFGITRQRVWQIAKGRKAA